MCITQRHSALFKRQSPQGWASCPITQGGFVRISSNPRLSSMSAIPATAWNLITQMILLPGHIFWPDDVQIKVIFENASFKIVGHQQITDTYLIALAVHHGVKLATFDRAAHSTETAMSNIELRPTELD